MAKNMIFLLIILLFGCATPKWQLNTPLDYLPKNKPLAGSGDDFVQSDNNFTVAPNLGILLNGRRAGKIYSGVSISGTAKNNLLNFQLMLAILNDYISSVEMDTVDMPKELQLFIPIKTVARLKAEHWNKDYILTPTVTLPILHLQMKFGFGNEANYPASIELRTGMAYDLYFRYKYANYYVSLFDGKDQVMALPTGINDYNFVSHITTISLNSWLLHLEANLILNGNECRTILGIGITW